MKTAWSMEFKTGQIFGYETRFINYVPTGEIVCFTYDPIFDNGPVWTSRKRIELKTFKNSEVLKAERFVKRVIRQEGFEI